MNKRLAFWLVMAALIVGAAILIITKSKWMNAAIGAAILWLAAIPKKKSAEETGTAQDAAVAVARQKAEEDERKKIEAESGADALASLSDERRERIAQAGRDAVASVLARRKRQVDD